MRSIFGGHHSGEAARRDGARHSGPARRGRSVALALLAAVAVAAAACSSGSSASTTTIDKAAAPGEISTAYQTLFNFTNKSVSSKIAVIQNGQVLHSSLTEALASSLSSSATGATIDSTTLASNATCKKDKVPSPCAVVEYDLLGSGGSALLSGQTGYAVYSGGKWLVAKSTICVLLDMFYSAEGMSGSPRGC